MADRLSPSYFFFVFGKIFGFGMVRLEHAAHITNMTLNFSEMLSQLSYMPI